MPRRTDGQKVDDLTERVARLEATFAQRELAAEDRERRHQADSAELRAEVRRLADRQTLSESKGAALEQRLIAVEKQHDRHCQLWLAAGGAGLAALVALLRSIR